MKKNHKTIIGLIFIATGAFLAASNLFVDPIFDLVGLGSGAYLGWLGLGRG